MSFDPASRAGLSPRQPQVQPIFFPPPPTSSMNIAHTKTNLKFKFGRSRSTTVQDPPKPILKKNITSTKRTRQWILLSLLILSFTILILSVIFAYCAALPHSDNIAAAQSAAAASSSGPVTTTETYSLVNIAAATQSPNPQATDSYAYGNIPRFTLRDVPKYTTDPQNKPVEQALAEDASNQARFSTSSAMASLTFYTATLPFLTMLHTSTELLTSLIRPGTSHGTRLGDVLRFRSADSEGVITRRRIGTLLSFSASAVLGLGWIIMQMFWVNCEIVPLSGHGSAEAVCPIQIRGHRMGGVSELSIGKVTLGFVVAVMYTGYCVYLVSVVGVFSKNVSQTASRVSSFSRRARFASRDEVTKKKDSDVESVVIAIEEVEDDKEMK